MREDSEEGAIMVRMDMRYMWSEMDSPCTIPKRRQPSRLVVFSRSSRWKKGSGESVSGTGGEESSESAAVFCQRGFWGLLRATGEVERAYTVESTATTTYQIRGSISCSERPSRR